MNPQTQQMDSSPFLNLGAVSLSHWRTILATTLLAVLAGLAVGWMRPERFTARTLLFVSQNETDPRAQMMSSQFPMAIPGIGGTNPNVKLIGTILKSRSLGDSIAGRFGRVQGTEIQNNSDGSILVEVTDPDPRRAARVANAYPEFINQFVMRVGIERSARKQAFLQRQLLRARGELEQSEEALVRFQRVRGAPEILEQSKRTMDAAVLLQQRVAEKEIEVNQLRRSATPDNPQLRAAVSELSAWREQLRRLTVGGGGSSVLLPLRDSPELKASTSRLLRDHAKNEQIYVSLTSALAQAQIDGNNSLPVVNVIDQASVPADPVGPGIPVILALAAIAGMLVGIAAAFLAEYLRAARSDAGSARFFTAWDGFKSDLRGLAPGSGKRRAEFPARG